MVLPVYDLFVDPENKENVQVAKVLILCNPVSGGKKGLKILKKVQPVLEEANIAVEVKYTEYAGHGKELAKTVELDGIDALCPIGGDGTVHEIVNGFMQRDDLEEISKTCAIAIIPGGSGNTLAFDLDINSVEIAAKNIIAGVVREIDLGVVESTVDEEKFYSVNIVGYGLPTNVLKVANKLRFLGGAQYEMAAYHSVLKNRSYSCEISFIDPEGETVSIPQAKYAMIQGQLTVHMGDKVPFCPEAKLDDGLLDLVLVPHMGRISLVNSMNSAKGTPKHAVLNNTDKKKKMKYYQCKEFTVTPTEKEKLKGKLTVNVDGELVGHSPFRVYCLKRSLRVIC